MPEFYHDLITEKSFQLLQGLKKKFNFVLIGGWAVWLYTKNLKSKDIDVVVDYDQLASFKKDFPVVKNERLKKYEVKTGGIDIDIYLPHFSEIGFPLASLNEHCQSLEGFLVPRAEVLLIMKVFAFSQRKTSSKGQKDLIDIFGLLKDREIDWKKYREIIQEYRLPKVNAELEELVSATMAVPELGLLNQATAKLKKKVLENL